MAKEWQTAPGGKIAGHFESGEDASPGGRLTQFVSTENAILGDALDKWWDIYNEFQGAVNYEAPLLPKTDQGFQPKCGWPDFLERMWQLKNSLDHAKRLCSAFEKTGGCVPRHNEPSDAV